MSARTDEPGAPPSAGRLRTLLGIAHNAFGTAVLIGFAWYVVAHRAEFDGVFEASVAELACLVALIGLTLFLNAVQNWLLFRGLGVDLRLREATLLMLATNFGNYLPMRAGTLVRAQYLKSVHGLPYAQSGSAFGVRTLITFFGTGVLGLFGMLLVYLEHERTSLGLVAVFIALMLIPAVAWVVPLPAKRERSGRVRRIFEVFVAGADKLRQRPSLGFSVLLAVLLQELTLVARFYLSTRALGADPSLATLLLLSPVATLASYAAITPGALGLREAAMGAATYAVGASFRSGALLGTLDRTVLLGVVAVAGGASFVYVWKRIKDVASARRLEATR